MVALPARPSPIAAPIAPPPRARPPAIRAPAMAIAWFIDFLLSGGCGLRCCRRFGLGCRSFLVRFLAVTFGAFDCHAEVDDREQEEDERLQGAHEKHVKNLPGGDQYH